MSRFIAAITPRTLQRNEGSTNGWLIGAPLLVVGALLVASGIVSRDGVQAAIGVLTLSGAATLLKPAR
jgi:hypothetical protein